MPRNMIIFEDRDENLPSQDTVRTQNKLQESSNQSNKFLSQFKEMQIISDRKEERDESSDELVSL